MLRSLLALFGFAFLLGALGPSCSGFGTPTCCGPQPDGSGSVCDSTKFTACVQACGETDTSAPAATCGSNGYSCTGSLIPAVSCPQSGWSTTLPCGPWPNGYDCGSGCAACVQGLWTCAPCGDSGTVNLPAN